MSAVSFCIFSSPWSGVSCPPATTTESPGSWNGGRASRTSSRRSRPRKRPGGTPKPAEVPDMAEDLNVIVATDCGSTTTKAILIEKQGEVYRQTYRGESPTTV